MQHTPTTKTMSTPVPTTKQTTAIRQPLTEAHIHRRSISETWTNSHKCMYIRKSFHAWRAESIADDPVLVTRALLLLISALGSIGSLCTLGVHMTRIVVLEIKKSFVLSWMFTSSSTSFFPSDL